MGSNSGHSSLGASVAHRWMNCPGSVRLSEGIESPSSIYAREGTAAHALAETCLRKNETVHDYMGRIIRVFDNGTSILKPGAAKSSESDFEVDEEMAEAVGVYLETVRADLETSQGALEVEKSFSLDSIFPDMGMFGRNDALIGEPWGALRVYDYKHGAGVSVNVENNPQLLYYALGAYLEQDYADVEIVIVQPRAPHVDGAVRRQRIAPEELMRWAKEELFPAALRTREPDAPALPGAWCRFCPALATCRAYAEHVMVIAKSDFTMINPPSPDALSWDEVLKIMGAADVIRGWLDSIFLRAQRQLENGGDLPGWKLIQRKSNRRWSDEAGLAKTLWKWRELGIYKKSLLSPAAMEKLMVKLGAEVQLEDFWEKPDAGVTIVPESDRRPAVRLAAFDAIENENP